MIGVAFPRGEKGGMVKNEHKFSEKFLILICAKRKMRGDDP